MSQPDLQQRLAASQRVARLGSWETDLSTLAVSWSDEMHRIFQTDPASFQPTHQRFLERIHPEDREAVDAAFKASADLRVPSSIEHRVLLADGAVRFVEERWQVTHDDAGRAVRAFGTCQDITELKLTHEALRQGQALLRMAGKVAQLGGWMIELPERRMIWSDEICAIHDLPAGTEPTLAQGLAWFVPEHREAVTGHLLRCEQDGVPYDLEVEKVTATGRRIWVRTTGEAVRNAHGKVVRIQGAMQDITERKQAEVALKQRDALLRIAGRVTSMGAWAIEVAERRSTWTDEVYDILGYPRGQLPSLKALLSLCREPGRARVVAAFERCRQEGTPFDLEVEVDSAAGRPLWLRLSAEAERDPAGGSISRVQGAVQDVTVHKETAREMARINRALQMLSRCSEAVIRAEHEQGLLEQTCRIVVESGGYRMAWVGFAADDPGQAIQPRAHAAAGQHDFPGLESEHVRAARGPAASTLRSGRLTVVAEPVRDAAFEDWRARAPVHGVRSLLCLPLREGERTFAVLVLYSTEVGGPGTDELELLQALADDLAYGLVSLRAKEERRQTQLELARQAALLDQATDAIFVQDLEHRVTSWNRGAERLYGWSASEMIGSTILRLLRPADEAAYRARLAHVLAAGEWSGEIQKVTRAGQLLTVVARWTLLRDERGGPQAVLVINTDVTEKKKLEAQFFRAQRMESIGTLAGGIAHDLNNALAPILMAIDVLGEKVHDDDGRDVLQTLQSSALRAANLVKQVLAFARGVDVARVPVSALAVLRDIEVIVRDTFPRNITWQLLAARDLWRVVGDATQIHQVFMNLCVNARDAMPRGGQLVVSLDNVVLDEAFARDNPEARPGAWVLGTVTDSGEGIAAGLQERIFEPFFTTKDVGAGTGLGLSTTLAIVRSHGGFVGLTSELGRGSSFRIYLPADPVQVQEERAPVVESRLPRGHGECVLVVDDEPGIRAVARRALERFGYRTLMAGDGAEAVTIFRERRGEIAVVLTDMAMPTMDGPTLVRALRAIDSGVRIIGASGFAPDVGVTGVSTHFLHKPYTAELLLKTLHQVLHGGG